MDDCDDVIRNQGCTRCTPVLHLLLLLVLVLVRTGTTARGTDVPVVQYSH
jgi:hypothetical protein